MKNDIQDKIKLMSSLSPAHAKALKAFDSFTKYKMSKQQQQQVHVIYNDDYTATITDGSPRGEKLIYSPLKTALAYHATTTGIKALKGPVGQGKSAMSVLDLLFTACRMPPCKDGVRRYKVGVIRQTYDQIKTTTFATIYFWFSKLGKVHKSMHYPMSFTCEFNDDYGPIVLEIIFRACKNQEDLEIIKSLEIYDAWINEITNIFSEQVIFDVQSRCARFPSLNIIDWSLWSINIVDEFSDNTDIKSMSIEVKADAKRGLMHYVYKTFNHKIIRGEKLLGFIKQSVDVEEFVRMYNANKIEGQTRQKLLQIILFDPVIRIDTNPTSESHFFYRLFKIVQPYGWKLFEQPPAIIRIKNDGPLNKQFEINKEADNYDNLTPNYYYNMLEGRSKEWISVYLEGKDGAVGKGKPVYSSFSRELHVAPHSLYDPNLPLYLSFDGGLTPACVVMQVRDNGDMNVIGCCQALDKGDNFQTGMDTFIANQLEPYLRINFPTSSIHSSVYDPSAINKDANFAVSTITILKRYNLKPLGFDEMTRRVSNNINLRVNAVIRGLTFSPHGRPQLMFSPDCGSLLDGLAGKYFYKETNEHGVLELKPCKNAYSHAQDALQYNVMNNILTPSVINDIKLKPLPIC